MIGVKKMQIPSSFFYAPVWFKGKIKGYRNCNNPNFNKEKEKVFENVEKLRKNKKICLTCRFNKRCEEKEMSLEFADFLNEVCKQLI